MRKMRSLEHERCPNCGANKLKQTFETSSIYNYKDYQKERDFRKRNTFWLCFPERPSWELAFYKCECCGSKLKVKKEVHFTKQSVPIKVK